MFGDSIVICVFWGRRNERGSLRQWPFPECLFRKMEWMVSQSCLQSPVPPHTGCGILLLSLSVQRLPAAPPEISVLPFSSPLYNYYSPVCVIEKGRLSFTDSRPFHYSILLYIFTTLYFKYKISIRWHRPHFLIYDHFQFIYRLT